MGIFGRIYEFLRGDVRGRRNRNLVAGAVIVGALMLVAVFANLIAPRRLVEPPPEPKLVGPSLLPKPRITLGTDRLGRDLGAMLARGTRTSLAIGLSAAAVALVIGAAVGIVSGYAGGAVDNALMRLMDVCMAFPAILLAILIVSILGQGTAQVTLAVGLVAIPAFARLVRGQALVLMKQEFILAARAAGVSPVRTVFTHLLPNCLPLMLVQTTFTIATAILNAAGLSYLGLGVRIETFEWGAILSDGKDRLLAAPWIVMETGLVILIAIIGFNLLGAGLRDRLDPRMRS